MTYELLLAQAGHGPGMHGGILVTALVAVAVVIGVVALVRRGRADREAGIDERESDRGPRS